MIALITNTRDVTTDFVVVALRKRNVAFVRINTDQILREWKIYWTDDGRWKLLSIYGHSIVSDMVQAVYYRRPKQAIPRDGTTLEAGEFISRESAAALSGFMNSLHCFWISHPSAIYEAEDKFSQITRARDLGFTVPRSLLTTDPLAANTFVNKVGNAIVKPASSGVLGGDPVKLAYTREIVANEDLSDVFTCPHLLQERIKKVADIRVTVVEDNVIACRLHSQEFPETSLDWRCALSFNIELRHEIVILEPFVANLCVQLVASFGLKFGAIDLVETANGYVFLEINPNGQWAWIEQKTGSADFCQHCFVAVTNSLVNQLS